MSMNNPDMDDDTLNAHLSEGIPALSVAAGRTGILASAFLFDMNTQGRSDSGMWGRDDEDYGKRWLHCDIREMAFIYTCELFKNLSDEGRLR
jgi:hypothetical protein